MDQQAESGASEQRKSTLNSNGRCLKVIDRFRSAKGKNKVAISRVDGNHRLYFAGGDKNKNYPALENVFSPFCITQGIKVERERAIFRTINAEQVKLKVDHLLVFDQILSTDEELWSKDKALYITGKLHDNKESPFYQRVHKAGKKQKGSIYLIKQKSLRDGVDQLLRNFPVHLDIKDSKTIIGAIINYFRAIKSTWNEEWEDKKDYKLMTNMTWSSKNGHTVKPLFPLATVPRTALG